MRGAFNIIAKHPWGGSDERYTFTFDAETLEQAEVKARAFVVERTAAGWACTMKREQEWPKETFAPTGKPKAQAEVKSLDDPLEVHLDAAGAAYISQTMQHWEGRTKVTEISDRDNIPYQALLGAIHRNIRLINRVWNKRQSQKDKARHDTLVGKIMEAVNSGRVGAINLYYTAVEHTLVDQLRQNGIERVEQIDDGIRMIADKPQNWMENDIEYLEFVKECVERGEWFKAFPILGQPYYNISTVKDWTE